MSEREELSYLIGSMKKEKIVKETFNEEIIKIPVEMRPIDELTGKRRELGRWGNSYQDMLDDIKRRKVSGELKESDIFFPLAGASKGSGKGV